MSCNGQRQRTIREQEAAIQMLDSGEYWADQILAEEKLRLIHESECDACRRDEGEKR